MNDSIRYSIAGAIALTAFCLGSALDSPPTEPTYPNSPKEPPSEMVELFTDRMARKLYLEDKGQEARDMQVLMMEARFAELGEQWKNRRGND